MRGRAQTVGEPLTKTGSIARIHTVAQWPVFARTEWLESTIVQIATVDANGIEHGKTWANRSRPSSSCHSAAPASPRRWTLCASVHRRRGCLVQSGTHLMGILRLL
jgi:hypothetical protein